MIDRLTGFADLGHRLLDETDRVALARYRDGARARRKPDRTWVTDADVEVERLLRERLSSAAPDHGVEGEELGSTLPHAEWRWILDPIDGTHSFMRGIDVWATLIGLVRGGTPVVGLASAPAMGIRWWAVAGVGAFRRRDGEDRPIGVSSVDRLDETQLLHGGVHALDGGVANAARHVWRDRGYGDFWGHMLVAEGAAEAMVEDGVSPWDMAAPCAIVTAAGGRMTDLTGRTSWTEPRLLTSNGLVHDELLELLAGDPNA